MHLLLHVPNFYLRQSNIIIVIILIIASKVDYTELNMSVYLSFYVQKYVSNCFTTHFITMYISQKMQVRWGEIVSSQLSVRNGAQQGGVKSPVLFAVYLDNLLKILKQRNIGCKIGATYLEVFGYADDLTLLCPSIAGL